MRGQLLEYIRIVNEDQVRTPSRLRMICMEDSCIALV